MLTRSELWRLSKVIQDEIFYQTRLMLAPGSQKALILEKYEKNAASARRATMLINLLFGIYPLFLVLAPLNTLIQVSSTRITPDNIAELLFASSLSFALYNFLLVLFTVVLGLMNLVTLMNRTVFDFFRPFPLSSSDLQQLSLYTLLRMNLFPLTACLIALPLAVFILILSPVVSIVLFLNNLLILTFGVFVLIIVSYFISQKVFNSFGNPFLKTILTMGSIIGIVIIPSLCMVAPMFFPIILDILGIGANTFPAEFLSLVCFPFSSAYLISLIVLPFDLISGSVLFTSIIGTLAFLGITVLVVRKGNNYFRKIAFDPTEGSYTSHMAVEDLVVKVTTSHPTITIMKQSIRMVFRNYSSLASLLAAIVIPPIVILQLLVFFLVFSLFSTSGSNPPGPSSFLGITVIFLSLIPFFINEGLTSAEKKLEGILNALPVKARNIFRSRQVSMAILGQIGPMIIVVWLETVLGFFNDGNSTVQLLALAIPIIFSTINASTIFLILNAFLFGKIHTRYTVYKVNLENTVLKYVALFGILGGILIGNLVLIELVSTILNIMFPWSLGVTIAVNLIVIVILEVIVRRMFK
ncbi:MAG: hypothetical protein ACFFDI_11355 [Promethearchaeota archaeon]